MYRAVATIDKSAVLVQQGMFNSNKYKFFRGHKVLKVNKEPALNFSLQIIREFYLVGREPTTAATIVRLFRKMSCKGANVALV